MLTNKISIKQNKYYINDIELNTHSQNIYLYGDIVKYDLKVVDSTSTIENIKIIKRNSVYSLGIVNENGIMSCPLLNNIYRHQLHMKYANHRLLVLITIDNVVVDKIYGLINNRQIDYDIIVDLYSMNYRKNIKNIQNIQNIPPNINCKTYGNNHISPIVIDQRFLNTFNIDPVQSLDFDDAISIENDKIYVHIVDIHNQIPINSTEDINAFKKAFTLYINKPLNIFPDYLAEDKLSLRPNTERYVLTVEFDWNGQVIAGPYHSVIINKHRYNYENFPINEIYGGKLIEFTKLNSSKTHINIPQIQIMCGYGGKMIAYKFESNNDICHKFIEALMIKTNIHISQYTKSMIPQRYHKIYDDLEENKKEMSSVESLIYLRSMAGKFHRALYSNTLVGHDALNLKTYTHFTSPIRRYFDVIVHRTLHGIVYDNIDEILHYINNREHYINNLVRLYNDWKIDDYIYEKIYTNGVKFNFIKSHNIIIEFLKQVTNDDKENIVLESIQKSIPMSYFNTEFNTDFNKDY